MSNLPEFVTHIACYLRRSREDLEAERRGENTLLVQRQFMVNEVLPRFGTHCEVYEEVASGDTIKDRPVFQQLMADLELGMYQAIAVKDLTRLGRGSYSDMGLVYDFIRDKRIFIITAASVLDPENPDDLRNIRFSMFLSREEYEAIVYRLVQGKYVKAQHLGQWVAGSVPYGYRYDRQVKKLVPDDCAKVVSHIFELFVHENRSTAAISTHLRKMGIPSPAGKTYWNPQTIRRLLQNPAYKGTLAYKRTKRQKSDGKVVVRPKEEQIIVDHAHLPVVSEAVWELAQQKIKRHRPKTPVQLTPTELAGVITCGTCRRKMVRQTSTRHYRRKDGETSVYQREFLACPACGHWVGYRAVEQQLIAVLNHLPALPLDGLEKWLRERASRSIATKNGQSSTLTDAMRRKSTIQRRLEKAREFLLDGTLTKEEFELTRNKHQRELRDLEDEIKVLQDLKSRLEKEWNVDVQRVLVSGRTLALAYRNLLGTEQKNLLLHTVFEEVELLFQGKSGRHNRFDLNVSLAYENLV